MNTKLNTRIVTRPWHQLAGVIACATMLTCCAERDKTGVLTFKERTQAMLAAARSDDIAMFGDVPEPPDERPGDIPQTNEMFGNVPETTDPGYVTRSTVSRRQHTFTELGADFEPDIDAAGRRMVFASTRHNARPDLYLKSLDGAAVTMLTSDPAGDIQPVFSPNGKHVAFASDRTGNWDIWVIDVDGGPAVQVTTGHADEIHPSWSRDGSQLVFCSRSPSRGQWELWIANAFAGVTKRFIGYGLFPEWSPVSDTIVYQRARERGERWFSIWTVTLVNGEPKYPTEISASATQAMIAPTWSQDGSRIAFASTPTMTPGPDGKEWIAVNSVFDIWVMNSNGSGRARVTDGYTANYAPTFGPDGSVFFASSWSGHENIWSLLAVPHQGETSGDTQLTRQRAHTQERVQKASLNDDL